MRIERVSWDWGLIVDVDDFPDWRWPLFGGRLFSPTTRAFGGVPGVVVRSARGRDLDAARRHCLLVHERTHWLQWLVVTGAATVPGWVLDWGWWHLAAAAFIFPVAYLVAPPVKRLAERWADSEQEDCIARERSTEP